MGKKGPHILFLKETTWPPKLIWKAQNKPWGLRDWLVTGVKFPPPQSQGFLTGVLEVALRPLFWGGTIKLAGAPGKGNIQKIKPKRKKKTCFVPSLSPRKNENQSAPAPKRSFYGVELFTRSDWGTQNNKNSHFGANCQPNVFWGTGGWGKKHSDYLWGEGLLDFVRTQLLGTGTGFIFANHKKKKLH